jgi:hypothetical protein
MGELQGELLAREGIERVQAADMRIGEMAGPMIRDAVELLIADGWPFTAEDVRRLVRAEPKGEAALSMAHHNLLPAMMNQLGRDPRVRFDGYVKPTRASRHGNPLRVWAPVRRAA